MKMKLFVLLCLLSSLALAREPQQVVESVYRDWYSLQPSSRNVDLAFFDRHQNDFAKETLAEILKGYGHNDQMWPGADLLFGGQVNVYGYTLGKTKITGDKAVVEVFSRLGLDRARSQVYGKKVELVKAGGVWVIEDIVFSSGRLLKDARSFNEFKAKQK